MIIPDEDVKTEEVKGWRGLHLLHFQGSSCSQKVRVLLREKGIACELHHVNLVAAAHTGAWFLGVNPRGVVPVLVHDGVVHVESNDILEYLDGAIPSPAEPFFPEGEEERRVVKESLAWEDRLHGDLRNLTMGFMIPKRFAEKSEEVLERYEKEGAADAMRMKEVAWWRDFAKRGVTPEAAGRSIKAYGEAFDALEARLADSDWLLCGRMTIMEVAWFISLHRLKLAGYPLRIHPRLFGLYKRLAGRRSFGREVRAPFLLAKVIMPAYQWGRALRGTTLRGAMRESAS